MPIGQFHHFREAMQMMADNMIKLALIAIMLDNKHNSWTNKWERVRRANCS